MPTILITLFIWGQDHQITNIYFLALLTYVITKIIRNKLKKKQNNKNHNASNKKVKKKRKTSGVHQAEP